MEVTLTDEQICVLDRRIDEFRAGDYQVKEKIVNRLLRRFKGDLDEEEFDALAVQTVCAPILTLGCSQIFPADSPAPLPKNQTGDKGIYSTNQQLGGPRNVRAPFTH